MFGVACQQERTGTPSNGSDDSSTFSTSGVGGTGTTGTTTGIGDLPGAAGAAGTHGTAGAHGGAGGSASNTSGDVEPARSCDERATTALRDASWERISTGFEDFVVTWNPTELRDDRDAAGFAGVSFMNGTWVMVGSSEGLTPAIRYVTSSDGLNWESRLLASEHGDVIDVSRVFQIKGQFAFSALHRVRSSVDQAVLYTSPDGHAWTAHLLPAQIPYVFDVASDGERVVLAGGNLWSSTDLASWTETIFNPAQPLSGVAGVEFGSGRWIASAVDTQVVEGGLLEQARFWGSADGIDWQLLDVDGNGRFRVVHRDSTWLASNIAGEFLLSSDGVRFDEVLAGGAWSQGPASDSPVVRAAGGRFVTVFVEGLDGDPVTLRVLASTDGTDWYDFGFVRGMPIPTDALWIEYYIADIAYGDCRYVAAGSYQVLVPGALDPPPFWNEMGPFVITADLAQ